LRNLPANSVIDDRVLKAIERKYVKGEKVINTDIFSRTLDK
jgi:hypothetical protein